MFIIYYYDSNAILEEPMNSRKCGEIIRAYRNVFLHIYRRGILPKIQRLDNKCSHILKDEMYEIQIDW